MKKLIQTTVFLFLTFMFCSFAPPKNGKVILIVSLETKNFTEWKKGFDAGASIREKAGITVMSVCQAQDNENQITVIEEAVNFQSATDFIATLKVKIKEEDFKKYKFTLLNKVD